MAVASDTAYELLKQRVIAGTYAPGAQLKEEHLARELDISRTPIRAALRRLVQDGLATADAGRGVRVSEWTEHDIQETYELRALLEGRAAELAARRGGLPLADQLDALNARMAQAIGQANGQAPGQSLDQSDERGPGLRGDPAEDALVERLQEINARFHRAILEASGSPRLRAMLAGLIDMPIVIRSYFISTRQDFIQSLNHHREIAAAVRIGDPDLARQAMQLHLGVAARRFTQRRREFGAVPCRVRLPA